MTKNDRKRPHWIFRQDKEGRFYSVQMWTGYPELEETGCSMEDLYQAFKERLLAEIASTRPSGVVVYVDGVSVDYLPLKDISKP